MLKTVSEVCIKNLPDDTAIGRVDKTKFFIFATGLSKQGAYNIAEKIFQDVIPAIKDLRVDEYNAQMMVITYTNRKNFNDTYDTMLSRVRRHINAALRQRNYGIISADERITTKMFSHASSIKIFGKLVTPEEQVECLRAVTSKDIFEVANEIFDDKNRSVSWVVPNFADESNFPR
jgi:hypothetical protein